MKDAKPITYTVRGRWPFPLDMMRRDRSRAATPEDQAKIDRLTSEHAPDRDAIRNRVDVTLVMATNVSRLAQPLAARWRSFGWVVLDDGREPEEAAPDAEDRPAAITFAVSGRNRFPLDMLRHDMCWPASTGDALMIHESMDDAPGVPPSQTLTHTVELRTAEASNVTRERWASFGWTVLDKFL